MLLPALLVRDYGLGGWFVFAIPNVIGAAAMGFVLGSREASKSIVHRHRWACAKFSQATIAYHVLVLPWVLVQLLEWSRLAVVILFVLLLGVGIVVVRSEHSVLGIAVLLSGTCVAFFLYLTNLPGIWSIEFNGGPRLSVTDMVLFAFATLCGFICCPYLDLTFHRARQSSGKAVFVIGFGVLFLIMIVFSLSYAGVVVERLAGTGQLELDRRWAVLLGLHILLQSIFTICVHLRETVLKMREVPAWSGPIVLLAIGLAIGFLLIDSDSISRYGITEPEVLYRCLLLFYGLVFPAYVWLCMLPTWNCTSQRARLRVWVCTVIVSLPMSYLGFVAGQSVWILGALAVLLFSRVVIELLPSHEVENQCAPRISQP